MGHTFIDGNPAYIPYIKDKIAYQELYGHHYWATKEQYQCKGTSIYVIDPKGAKHVKESVKDAEVVTIYLMADEEERRYRLGQRYWKNANLKIAHELNAIVYTDKRIERGKQL